MKHLKTIIIGFFVLLLPLFLFQLQNKSAKENGIIEGEVTEIINETTTHYQGETQLNQVLEVEVLKGEVEEETIRVETAPVPQAGSQKYKAGDQVVISSTIGPEGENVYVITDYVRRAGLYVLYTSFVVLAVLVGHIWGASSLLGMAFSFFIIFQFILPQIVAGKNAVTVAVLGASIIIPVTFSLSHGLKTKTFIAVVGTVITLVLTGLLAKYFVDITHLTGFASEEAGFLQVALGENINMEGVLLAGIIIAALGVLDDITISQASVVSELKKANKKLGFGELFTRSMNVGRDHIASLINTLVLVYTGASLPLLLLFINNPRPFSEVVNYEIIADEIVRTLVGSIGLILAVPITTFLAAYYFSKKGA